jgi:molecular chaperone GrpE
MSPKSTSMNANEARATDDQDDTAMVYTPDEEAGEKTRPDPAQELKAENAALKDRLLRTLADMDNLRKRTEREISDAKAYAVTALARDLLPVSDNLGRALAAAPVDDSSDPTLQVLSEGVSLTERELLNTLGKHGVVRIDPQGERFDPNLHQAMFEVEDPGIASGTVVQVIQPGFTISGRVLRPAMVGVSKGGPKPVGEGIDRSV